MECVEPVRNWWKVVASSESLYEGNKACVTVGNETSDWFTIDVGLR